MRSPKLFLLVAGLSTASACAALEDELLGPIPDGYYGSGGSGVDAGGAGSGASSSVGGAVGTGDLPCEVAAVLEAHCDSCHATNIPPLLRTHAELAAPSSSDPSKSFAEVSVERMQDAAAPMPPGGLPPASDVQVFSDWVASGMPTGDCGGGTGGAGGNPYDTPVVCTSDQIWNDGHDGGKNMYPGRACNDCHADNKPEEIYTFAGTVYPTAHEPDDCLGVSSGEAVVEFTDANDDVVTATTNASGNFTFEGSVQYPVTVRVLANGKSLPMVAPLQPGDGDCNTCHSQDGDSDAPGRIILPF